MSDRPAHPAPASPRLHCDGVRELRLFGWVVGARPGQEALHLLCNGRRVAAPVWRVARPDVVAALGVADTLLGFEIDLPPALWAARDDRDGVTLGLEVDGQASALACRVEQADLLQLVDEARALPPTQADRQRALAWRAWVHLRAARPPITLSPAQRQFLAGLHNGGATPATLPPPLPAPLRAMLETRRHLLLSGWASGPATGAETIELCVDGEPVRSMLRRLHRADVQQALGLGTPWVGFELELPAGLWARADDRGQALLQLRVDGFPCGPEWSLKASDLPGLLAEADRHPVDGQRRRLRLLALEHLGASGVLATLPAEQRADVLQRAQAEGVAHWLVPEPAAEAPSHRYDRAQARRAGWADRRSRCRAILAVIEPAKRRARPGTRWHERVLEIERRLTLGTGLFDAALYERQAPHLGTGASLADLVADYVNHGAALTLLPNLLVDPRRYTGQLPGRRPPAINPLLHWALHGRWAGLQPSSWFEPAHYLRQNADVARAGVDPLHHYLQHGWREGRTPVAGFDSAAVAIRPVERRALKPRPSQAQPLLEQLLDGLPARLEPSGRRAPSWWPVTSLDGIDHLTPALWQGLTPRGPHQAPPSLDVLIPVYAGLQETLSCILSVLSAPVTTRFELVVINDMSPEPALSAWLERLADAGLLSLQVNRDNLGFVRTVNRGLALHSERDVVILNSDTVVFPGWLDRLAAHGQAGVGSITPLSNNATLCSYPLTQAENWAELELGPAAIDALVARTNAGRSVEAPTGVGFCMWMARAAMTQVGTLDVEHFGRGYGEENDWCQRVAAAGWRNLLAEDVYVQHRGSVSFGSESIERMGTVLATLERLHPGYEQRVSAWLKADPLHWGRARLDAARLVAHDPRPRIVSISHDRGGGTARHEDEMAQALAARGIDVLRLRPGQRPGTLSLRSEAPLRLPNLLDLPADQPGALRELLRGLGVTGLHLHHLIDHAPALADTLDQLLARPGLSFDVTVHDYWLACPRVNLVDASGVYCGEPGPSACDRCLANPDDPLAGADGSPVRIGRWRQDHEALLAQARRILVPDADVATRMGQHFPGRHFEVVPHEALPRPTNLPHRRPARAPGHVLVIGALSAIKGFHVLQALGERAQAGEVPLRLTLLGYSMDDDALRRAGVHVHGRYDDRELQGLIAQQDPDLILIPSVWPETYSYVLSEALVSGHRVALFDIGAPARRLREWGEGLVLPLDLARSPAALAEALVDDMGLRARPVQNRRTA